MMDQIDKRTLRGHVAFLTDNKLKGRHLETARYLMSVDNVPRQYEQIVLLPA